MIARQDIYEMLATPGGAAYWERFGRAWMDPAFFSLVDDMRTHEREAYEILSPVNPRD